MPLSTGKAYLEKFADDLVAQHALLACAAALRLDDESAFEAIALVAQSNGRTRQLLHEVKNLGCVWRQWDGSWYLAEEVRKELVDELYRRVPQDQITKLRSQLAEQAEQRAAILLPDGQITAHRLRTARIEAGFQRIFIPGQVEQGGEQLGDVWETATPSAGEATARSVDYLAPEIEEHIGQLPVQVLFLRGMAARARRHRADQEKYFRAVWERGTNGRIFAVAAHFFANLVKDKVIAERALQDSLSWYSAPVHQAQVWHSLGNLLTKQPARWKDAEEAYKQGLEFPHDATHRAQAEASLANLLSKYQDAEADNRAAWLAQHSLELDPKNLWTRGVCYRVLADIYERRGDYRSAIAAVESLIHNDRKLGDTKHRQRRKAQLARLRHALSETRK